MYKYDPDCAIPPGETLKEALEDREISPTELAAQTELNLEHVNQVIKGCREITADMAARFEHTVGIPAYVWVRLERNYRKQLNSTQKE